MCRQDLGRDSILLLLCEPDLLKEVGIQTIQVNLLLLEHLNNLLKLIFRYLLDLLCLFLIILLRDNLLLDLLSNNIHLHLLLSLFTACTLWAFSCLCAFFGFFLGALEVCSLLHHGHLLLLL